MCEETWREVWCKSTDNEPNKRFSVIVYYSEMHSIAVLYGRSFKQGIWSFASEETKLVSSVKNYAEAIEWGQEITEQWFTKYRLQASKNEG